MMPAKENKQFWDLYASDFDAIYGTKNSLFNNLINFLFRQAMRIRFEKTLKSIPDDNVTVIDIGCGPGHYCIELARSGQRNVTGIDFSETMINLAKKNAERQNINDISFSVKDVFQLPHGQKYDYSIMMGFLEYFKDPGQVIKKAVELTGCKIFISLPVAGGLLGWQRKIRYRNRCFLRLYSHEDIVKLMQNQDIKSYSIERISRDYFVTINLTES